MKKTIMLAATLFSLTFSASTFPAPQEVWTWDDERYGGIITQELDNSCGLAALATIMRTHFGDERFDEHALVRKYVERASERELADAMTNGLSLLEIEKLAQSLGYTTSKKVLSLNELERVVSFVPVLVYLEIGKFRHFAVVKGVSDNDVLLADPSRGNVEYSREKFLSEWRRPEGFPEKSGAALIIIRNEGNFAQNLLQEPPPDIPQSFTQMKRLLIGY